LAGGGIVRREFDRSAKCVRGKHFGQLSVISSEGPVNVIGFRVLSAATDESGPL
jgi:hypothetical protein